MCAVFTIDDLCWPVIVGIGLVLAAAPLWWMAVDRQARLAARSLPFEEIRLGPTRLSGRLRAEAGRVWLEEAGTRLRVRIDPGFWPVPPPDTPVSLIGDVIAREPDPRATTYRDAAMVWLLHADEICQVHERSLLPVGRRSLQGVRLLQLAALLSLFVGLLLGVCWPSWFHWCRCHWPPLDGL